MNRSHLSRSLAGCAVLLAAISLSGCELTVPASDPTPPEVSLTVTGLGQTFTVDAASGAVSRSAPAGAEVVLLASGRDKDGGVKNISIGGGGSVSCSSGDLGQIRHVHYSASNPEAPGVGVGDEARDQRLTTLEIDVDGLIALCSGGFRFGSGSVSFVATAENFHGGTASTPTFTLSHP